MNAAQVLDAYWNGQLPVDPVRIANAMGVSVVGQAMEDSGQISLGPAAPVITFNVADAPVRQRFTVAHEIGHLALGHLSSGVTLYRDSASNFSSASFDPKEREANAFAAQLLMPANTLEYAIAAKRMTDVAELAQVFGVSQVAMGYRLANLGLLRA